MNIRELATKFSEEAPTLRKHEESLNRIESVWYIGSVSVSEEIEEEPDLGLNARDHISINMQCDEGVIATYKPTDGRNWVDFIQAVKDNDDEENMCIVVDVNKSTVAGRVSIYEPDDFASYLESSGIEAALCEFDSTTWHQGNLTLEVQKGNFAGWQTNHIAFVALNGGAGGFEEAQIEKVHENQRKVCTTNIQIDHLTPDMFLVTQGCVEGNRIQTAFHKMAQILSYYYLFDQLTISRQGIDYKMVGLKCINGTINANVLGSEHIGIQSAAVYVGIYKWLYEGGNIYDKAIIARNVLSLNINEETLSLGSQTLDAVTSNFNIYEKENVKQYIEVRNKVTEQVSKIQKDIMTVIDDYTGGFLKIMTANLTFFLTVIVIRVLAKGMEEKVLMPNVILYISYGLLAISLAYLLYARCDALDRKKLKETHFVQLIERYGDILGEKESSNLSIDFDKMNKKSTAYYLENRITAVTWLWGICLGIVFIAVTGVLIDNLMTK